MTVVDAKYWFLDKPLIPRSPAYTEDNEVTALIDGQAYMEHLHTQLFYAKPGDCFHYAGWQVTPSQKLLGENVPGPTFIDAIRTLVQRGVTVRVMLDRNFFIPGNRSFVNEVNELNLPNGVGIEDARLPPGLTSHHQKTAILTSQSGNWGYVGGLDIAEDRWDTPLHNSTSTNPGGRTKKYFDAFHDVHCAVQGPAVEQLWTNFAERWNDPAPPGPGQIPLLPIAQSELPPTGPTPAGKMSVQVLRTLSCHGKYSENSPLSGGEQTIRLAYEKAIDQAKHYVYIEEQYLWPCTVVDKLCDAAKRDVKVILVMPKEYDFPVLNRWHNWMRQQALTTIGFNDNSNVYAYDLGQSVQTSQIYVHSKVMIVDDRFAAIGSANISDRSFTTDTELHVGVVDGNLVKTKFKGVQEDTCQFAKELRLTLWKEHLGLTSNMSIDDPISSLEGAWPQFPSPGTTPTRTGHVGWHFVPFPRTAWPSWMMDGIMNPRTVCP